MFKPNKITPIRPQPQIGGGANGASKSLAFIVSVLTISLSLAYFVLAWTEPSVNPPNPDPNISTPLNIGSTGQSKAGNLTIHNAANTASLNPDILTTFGGAILNTGGAPNGLIVQSGNVGIGTTRPGAKLDVNGAMIFRAISQPPPSSPNQVVMYLDPSSLDLKISVNGQPYVSLLRGAGVPFQVTGLTATPGNTQEVVLNWPSPIDNGSAITNYKVYRSTTSGAETLLTTLGNVLTYSNTGLVNGTTYYYKVSAVNGVGEGNQSAEANVMPVGPPSQVPGLSATTGDTRIYLSWSAPASNGGSAITNYKVYRSTTSGAETLLTTLGNVLTYSNTGLINGTGIIYYYKVSAVNVLGEGPQSSEAGATAYQYRWVVNGGGAFMNNSVLSGASVSCSSPGDIGNGAWVTRTSWPIPPAYPNTVPAMTSHADGSDQIWRTTCNFAP